MRAFAAIAAALLFATLGSARAGLVGSPAPELRVETTLQGPAAEDLTWPNLSGQAVVLELWATWCGPCVAAIPHWNELAETFSDRPLTFLSVSDDPEGRLRRFLKSRPIQGHVALDSDRSVFDGFGVTAVPRTFLIDAQGLVRAVTHPAHLDETMLEDLLAGADPQAPPLVDVDAMIAERLGELTSDEPVFRALVRPARDGQPVMSVGPDHYMAFGYPVSIVLTAAYETSMTRVVLDATLPDHPFDFVFATPGRPDFMHSTMRQALEASFGFEAKRETRGTDVLILTRIEDTVPKIVVSEGDGGGTRMNDGRIEAFNVPIGSLTRLLEIPLEMPVLDETGLPDQYDASLRWDPERPDTIFESIHEQWGLQLRRGHRPIEVLRLTPR